MIYVFQVAYDGASFYGFQRQSKDKTVQGELERVFSSVFDEKIELVAAGRTDRGVHALGQVVSFESNKVRPLDGITRACHGRLAPKIVIKQASILKEGTSFHPRFDALSRTYDYLILSSPQRCSELLWGERYWCLNEHLDLEFMREASRVFLGEHDFITFSARAEVPHHRRELREIKFDQISLPHYCQGQAIRVQLTANAFLRRMVRLLVAALVQAGQGEWGVEDILNALEAKDPALAPPPAPSSGLYLSRVDYARDPFQTEELAERVLA